METDISKLIQDFLLQSPALLSPSLRISDYGEDVVVQFDLTENASNNVEFDRRRFVSDIQRDLSSLVDKSVWVVLTTDAERETKERFIADVLNRQLPDRFSEVFLSYIDRNLVSGWLVPRAVLTSADIAQAKRIVAGLIAAAGENADEIQVVGYEGTIPAAGAILRRIKIHQPVVIEELREALEIDGFNIPPEKWLLKQLDHLRQKELVAIAGKMSGELGIRYALTMAGLLALPHQSGKKSSDVAKALGFRNRKW